MPFTLSHPAAVLPLLRHPFSAVALVAGALAPDLPYFARRMPVPVSAQSWYEPFMNATTSHGLVGALTVSLPYGVMLCGLYLVARRPVGALVAGARPAGAGRTPTAGAAQGAGHVVARAGWVLLSLLIGIATHLVWDSFTHSDGYVVMHVPALTEPLVGGLTWARALQHGSTVAGLVLIAVYVWRRRSRLVPGVRYQGRGTREDSRSDARADGRSVVPSGVRRALWVAGGVAIGGAVVGTLDLWGGTGLTAGQTVEAALSGAATGAGAALIGALFVYVAVWWAVRGVLALREVRRAAHEPARR